MGKRGFILLLAVHGFAPALCRAQTECEPRELPYTETFTDYWSNYTPLYGAQGTDHCWTLWQGVPTGCNMYQILFWNLQYIDPGNNGALNIRCGYQQCDINNDGYIDSYTRFQQTIVSPPLAESPAKMTFKASIHGLYTKEKFAYIIVGYVRNMNSIGYTFVPLDTFAVQRRPDTNDVTEYDYLYWNYDTLRLADTLPLPCHLAFRIDSTLQRRNHPLTDTTCIFFSTIPHNLFNDEAFIDDVTFHPWTHIYTDYYDTLCEGETYRGHGLVVTPDEAAGVHQFDSVAADTVWHFQLHLHVIEPIIREVYRTLLPGETFYFDSVALATDGDYVFSYTNRYGCDSTVIVHVTVDSSAIANPWFPNVFTPDGETNNRFRGYMNYMPAEYTLYIFNRWGNQIFHTTDPHSGWDGTYRGAALPQGAYVYKYKVLMPNGIRREGIGTVTLLR